MQNSEEISLPEGSTITTDNGETVILTKPKERRTQPLYVNRKGGSSILNKPGWHRTASVSYAIDHNVSVEPKEDKQIDFIQNHIYANVSIADCTRSIRLDFDIYETDTGENELYKIRTLIKTLKAFEKDLKKVLEDKKQVQEKIVSEYQYTPNPPIFDLDEYFKVVNSSLDAKKD